MRGIHDPQLDPLDPPEGHSDPPPELLPELDGDETIEDYEVTQ